MTDIDFEKFRRLYKKFIEGTRWLSTGEPTQQDKDDFNRLVVAPMDALWAEFTDEDKEYWDKVRYAVDLFGGTIVDEDMEQQQRKRKQWRKYSQSY